MLHMSPSTKKDHPTPRQIVGISLPPKTASEFKAEAGRRGVSLRKLFEEMWAAYGEKKGQS